MIEVFKAGQKLKFTDYGYTKSRVGIGVWKETSKDTIFTVTKTEDHVNCKEFEISFHNNWGLRMPDKWFMLALHYGCKYSCKGCSGKCDLWESE